MVEAQAVGPVKIVVCIKQVPLLSALRFDQESRRLIREGVPVELNELDVYALSEAVRLREIYGGEVIAITMGPPAAHEALANAIAIGANRAIHLSDRAFSGADTLATARTLALAIQREQPDLIFCGRHSIDAETAQVGPEIAELLDIPQITAVQSIDIQLQQGQPNIIATRETDDGTETLSTSLPALITTAEKLNEGIWPDEKALRKASQQEELYQVLTAADLGVDITRLGQTGSPTWVSSIEADTYTRAGRIIAESDPEQAIDQLIADLIEHGFLKPDGTPGDIPNSTSSTTPEQLSARREALKPDKAVWVIAETSKDGIRPITFELLGKGRTLAKQLQGELAAVLIGNSDIHAHIDTLGAYGADKVYVATDDALAHYSTEGYTAVLAQAIEHYRPAIVLFSSTSQGRDLAPRIAARLGLGLTGDCIDLGLDEQQRLIQYKPAFGGSIISLILSHTTPAMATIRPGMLQAAVPQFNRHPAIEQLSTEGVASQIRTHLIKREYHNTGVTELETASIVLGVGIGAGSPENYGPIYELAQLLHAAIGTTRNVADKGWLPRQTQIGLTGRAVSPPLYIALGIRGAPEHIAGIRKAGYVVSINKNKRALIFRHSDVGVVGDLNVLLPLLIEKLKQMQ